MICVETVSYEIDINNITYKRFTIKHSVLNICNKAFAKI